MNITKKIYKNIYLIKDNSGFGLLELVIALSLLGIILAISFSFLFFGSNTFSLGEQQTDVQQNARIVADFISKELRIAERIVIVNGYEDLENVDIYESPGEYLLYYIYDKDGAVFYEIPDDTYELTQFIKEISGNIYFTLEFNKSETNSDIINFIVTAMEMDSGRTYSLETEVLVLNLSDIEDESSGTGSAIFYQIPAPPDPGIRSILISPQSHGWTKSGTFSVDLEIWTYNAPDDTDVKAKFFYIQDENEVLKDDSGKIENNKSNLTLSIVDEGHPNLDFGFYFFDIELLDNDTSQLDVQRRFYYVEPDLTYEGLDPHPGNPHIGTVTLKTGGVPSGTEAITYKTEFSDDDYFDDVVIKLMDENDVLVPFEFNPTGEVLLVDGEYGKLEFGIKVDNPKDARKDLKMAVLIGKTEFGPFDIYEEIQFEPLSDLQVHLTAAADSDILQYNPDSDTFERVFEITIDSGQDSVWILTELDKSFEGALIYINDTIVNKTNDTILNEVITEVSVNGLNKIDIDIDDTYKYTININWDNL